MKKSKKINFTFEIDDQFSKGDLLLVKGGATATNKSCPINNVAQCGCTVNTVAGCGVKKIRYK